MEIDELQKVLINKNFKRIQDYEMNDIYFVKKDKVAIKEMLDKQ